MKEKIIFEAIVGSKLYGTNDENSDTDIKGVFLPDIEDLILCKAPKCIQESTSKDDEKNNKDDVDKTYYSLQYFLELASKGETNAMDILFAYTNKDAILKITPEWEYVINNIDKILTKNINAFMGYCKSQCIKYSVKGEKLNNFNKFKNFCERHLYDIDKNGSPILLYKVFKNQLGNNFKIPIYEEGKVKFNKIDFGDHCYLMTEKNNKYFIIISDIKIQLESSIKEAYHKINNVITSYGKRAEEAASNNGVDYKAISHCIRVLFEVEEILTKHKIEFPLKEKDFIKSIKYKTTALSRDEIMDWIEKKITYIENNLIENSNLQDKADFKWIKNCICKSYGIYSSFFNLGKNE